MRDITSANKAPATHAAQHAKGGNDQITPESIGAAPGGYGSGDYGKILTADDDLNTLTVGGHYLFFGNSIPKNAPTGLNDWTAYVIENLPYNDLVAAQILHIIVPNLTDYYGKYSNCSLSRTHYGNDYTPWAWINPPMELGVEYMTTEHYLGKPVYVKAVNFGVMPNNSAKAVSHGITNLDVCFMVYGHDTGNHRPIPTMCLSGNFTEQVGVTVTGSEIVIHTTFDANNNEAIVVAKYTKTTD